MEEKQQKRQVSFRIDANTAEAIYKYAFQESLSVSKAANKILKEGLKICQKQEKK